MTHFLLVALGGALGASARYVALRLMGPGFPWGTLSVNVVGSLLMGLLIGWLARRGVSAQSAHLFLATGVLGGFTTFSAFSLDAVSLWERGEPGLAVSYVLTSVFVSIAALFAGLALTRLAV